ncbi:MAG TPA: TSUP family transporter, partial [Acetobacteraceae bacterium]|nr:TSUP family transporter [Acetobacteraceae bacterium]
MAPIISPVPGVRTALAETVVLPRDGRSLPRGIAAAALDPHGRFGLMLLALGGAGLVALYCETLRDLGLLDGSVAVALAIFVAALTSGIAGFAFSGICGALLFHVMAGPVAIVRLMMACSIANQAMGVWAVRRAVHWPSLRPFLLGGLVGVPLGVFL